MQGALVGHKKGQWEAGNACELGDRGRCQVLEAPQDVEQSPRNRRSRAPCDQLQVAHVCGDGSALSPGTAGSGD